MVCRKPGMRLSKAQGVSALYLLCVAVVSCGVAAAPAPAAKPTTLPTASAKAANITLSGKLVKYHSDRKGTAKNSWAMRIGATRLVTLELSAALPRRPRGFVPGNKAVVYGRYASLTRFIVIGFGPIKPLVGTATGTQKVIMYLMKVCGRVATVGNTGRTASSADLMKAMFEGPASVAGTWRKCSFDLLKLDRASSVVFPVDVGCSRRDIAASCEDSLGGNLAYYADLAARTAEKELAKRGISATDDFDYQMYFFPATKCPWAGEAYIADVISRYSGGAGLAPNTMIHELGHNLGLDHSSTDEAEYGDLSSAMGNPSASGICYSLPQQAWLGWHAPSPIDSSNLLPTGILYLSVTDTLSSPKSGYRINPTWASPRARVFLYLSYFPPNATAVAAASRGKVHVHQFSDGEADLHSYLLARLGPRQDWNSQGLDWYSGADLVITFLSLGEGSAQVSVCLKGRGQCCGVCPPPPPPQRCSTVADTYYWGGDIASIRVDSSGGCCAACGANKYCRAWSYFPAESKYPNLCYLKRATRWQTGRYRGVTSGSLLPTSG